MENEKAKKDRVECEICKITVNRNYLRRHVKSVHYEERPFECPETECPKTRGVSSTKNSSSKRSRVFDVE